MSRTTQLRANAISLAVICISISVVGAQIPDLEVLCGQYSVFCASSCQTYQQQCASTYGQIGATNNNIPVGILYPNKPVETNQQLQENRIHVQLHLQPPPQNKVCKTKNAACSTNKDCCLEFFCKHHKQADGYPAKIGTCQIPFYLHQITPRLSDEARK